MVQELEDREMVMYEGKKVEKGNIKKILDEKIKNYKEGIIYEIKDMDEDIERMKKIKG